MFENDSNCDLPPCLVPYLNLGMSDIGFHTFSFVSVEYHQVITQLYVNKLTWV